MKRLLKPKSVKINSLISFSGILLSRILGFARDMLIGYFFGTSPITDAFNITMKVVFYLANQISSAFNIAFLSMFIHEKEQKGKQKATVLANNIISFVALFGIIVSLSIYLLSPWISMLYPGLEKDTYFYLVNFLKWSSFSFFFIITSGILWSLFQSVHIFTIPYIAVLIQNFIIVILIYLFPLQHILSISVLLATATMFLFTLIPVHNIISISIVKPKWNIIKQFLKLASPTLISTGIIYFSVLADQIMASFMPVGSITRLEYANKIASLPPAMFGIAIAGAFFPRLSELVSQRKWNLFKQMLEQGISAIWFLTIPSAIGLIIMSKSIVNLLFYFPGGKFTQTDVMLTSGAMAMYALGIPFQSAIIAFNRGHYAFKDTITPLTTSTIALILNIILNYLLGIILKLGIQGLALGTSLAATVNFYLLGKTLEKKTNFAIIGNLIKDFLRITTYTLPMALFLICINMWFNKLHKFTTLLIIITSAIIYLATMIIVRPPEVISLIKKK